jgi:predicted RNA-binding Zn-ribbon protein involved in translation (DUF1610 family)
VAKTATVLAALRRFLPDFLEAAPPLSAAQRRALWALTHCRTAALGGRAFGCQSCGHVHFAYHSCNHKACPQCGAQATERWIQRELRKRVNAPYFLITFTLPAELRGCFWGAPAKQAYDLFFTAVASSLSQKLASDKGLRAPISGFTALLHTWTQRLDFHPHIHCLVPGAGLGARGQYVRVKNERFLVYLPHLQSAFRQHLYRLFQEHQWSVDPQVWRKDWGVHIQPAGSGAAALKYLGRYVARTAITDSRLLALTERSVTFRWKDRDRNRNQTLTLPGVEFVRRYLRHVLPVGLRSVRYYGFCHPTAKAKRLRVQLHSGRAVELGSTSVPEATSSAGPRCPRCGQPAHSLFSLTPAYAIRGPPAALGSTTSTRLAA